jgi:hypothetical protein
MSIPQRIHVSLKSVYLWSLLTYVTFAAFVAPFVLMPHVDLGKPVEVRRYRFATVLPGTLVELTADWAGSKGQGVPWSG